MIVMTMCMKLMQDEVIAKVKWLIQKFKQLLK